MSHQFTGERRAGVGFPHRVGRNRKWSSLDIAPPTSGDQNKDAASLAPIGPKQPAEPKYIFWRRPGGIDYANFPRDAAYISVSDVDDAYKQGLRDRSSEIEGLQAEISWLKADLEIAHLGITALGRSIQNEPQSTQPIGE